MNDLVFIGLRQKYKHILNCYEKLNAFKVVFVVSVSEKRKLFEFSIA